VALKTKSKPTGRRRQGRGNQPLQNDNGDSAVAKATVASGQTAKSPAVASRTLEPKVARPDSRIKAQPSPIVAKLGGVTKPVHRVRHGLARFVWDIRAELRKVVWPSRKEAINLTLIVVAVSAAMGVFLGGVDYLFRKLFELLVSV
jgi:preprotein translocase subunit SecE